MGTMGLHGLYRHKQLITLIRQTERAGKMKVNPAPQKKKTRSMPVTKGNPSSLPRMLPSPTGKSKGLEPQRT
jgi:hypothetical protein